MKHKDWLSTPRREEVVKEVTIQGVLKRNVISHAWLYADFISEYGYTI